MSTVTPEQLSRARDAQEAAQRKQFEEGQRASEKGDLFSDAQEKKQTAQHDKDIAEGDFRRTEGELRQRDEELRGANEGQASDDRQIRDLERQREQSAAHLEALKGKYDHTKEWSVRELRYQFNQDAMRAINQNANRAGEVLIKALASIANLSEKILAPNNGSAARRDTRLELVNYLELRDGRTPQWVAEGDEIKATEEDLAAQDKKIADQQNDPYHRERIADAQKRRDEKASEHAQNTSADEAATKVLDGAKAATVDARTEARKVEEAKGQAGLDLGKKGRAIEELDEKWKRDIRAEDRKDSEERAKERAEDKAERQRAEAARRGRH